MNIRMQMTGASLNGQEMLLSNRKHMWGDRQ